VEPRADFPPAPPRGLTQVADNVGIYSERRKVWRVFVCIAPVTPDRIARITQPRSQRSRETEVPLVVDNTPLTNIGWSKRWSHHPRGGVGQLVEK